MAVITHSRYMLIERLNYLPRSPRMALYIDCAGVCVTRPGEHPPPVVERDLRTIRGDADACESCEDANRELWQPAVEGPAEFAIA